MTAIPPFERFYVEHRDIVLGFLRRRLGANAAEDAFQETFLRALRAYPRLEHGEHLRAWVLTIAARLVIDSGRRARPAAEELPELVVEDGRPGVRPARASRGLAAAHRTGCRRPPLRLRPALRRHRRRARLEPRSGPPGRLVGDQAPARRKGEHMTVSHRSRSPLPRRGRHCRAPRRRLRRRRLARRPLADGGLGPRPLPDLVRRRPRAAPRPAREGVRAARAPLERRRGGGPPAARRVLRGRPAGVRARVRPSPDGAVRAPRPRRAGSRPVRRDDDVRSARRPRRRPAGPLGRSAR